MMLHRAAPLVLALCGLTGCVLGEPEPIPLELELDEDEPIPLQPVLTPDELAEQRRDVLRQRLETMDGIRADEARCPPTSYRELDVPLDAGPTFDRIAYHHLDASSITLADHPVKLPGVRYYQVWAGAGACLYGWHSFGCFVDDQAVHCEDRSSTDTLESFIETHELHRHPERLTDRQWLHLVAVLVGASRLRVLPGGDCGVQPEDDHEATSLVQVTRSDGHLALEALVDRSMGPFEEGDPIRVRLRIDDGEIDVSLSPKRVR